MQLYDKDLLSVQEVRELVEKAKTAQQELAAGTQADVDRIVKSVAQAGVRNAKRLAKLLGNWSTMKKRSYVPLLFRWE